jgi:SAM-dependent methyltransferase
MPETAQWKQTLKKVPLLVPAVRFARTAVSPSARSFWMLKTFGSGTLFQPSGSTRPDRYPEFFAFIRDKLTGVENPRILSFGCSTGEEVSSLSKYLPQAKILGIDINPRSIGICHRALVKAPNPQLSFKLASSPAAEPSDHYDAIFCMAVLRNGELRTERPDRCDHLISFADFEAIIADLARCLKPGGYLVLWHSHFCLSDCHSFLDFEPVFDGVHADPKETPIYDRNNRLTDRAPMPHAIFQKKQASQLNGTQP